MKKSQYNMLVKYQNTNLMFNSVSCALAEVDNDFFDILNNIKSINYESLLQNQKEIFDNMVEGNYIIPDEANEIDLLKYKNLSAKFNGNVIRALTIAPTIDCNFACPYCYENAKKGLMSEKIQTAIIDAIKTSVKYTDSFELTWYGGEPLVAKDIILDMSQKIFDICAEYNVEYSSSMITNGYLLNEELIKKLIKLKITNYQITIDGPPEIHNQRRMLRHSDKDTFNTIINNIKILEDNNAIVNIRINVDKTNLSGIESLLDILEKNDLKNCNIHFGHVKLLGSICNSALECMKNEEFADFDLEYNKILQRKGFNSSKESYYPKVKSNYCCADSSAAWVIDPEGYMYNCWNEVGNIERASGNIENLNNIPYKMLDNNIKYMLWSPFEQMKCRECSVLPICMGGCPDSAIKNNEAECDKWKYILEQCIINQYLLSIKENAIND